MAACEATVEALESLYRADLPRFVRTATAITGDEAAGIPLGAGLLAIADDRSTSHLGSAPGQGRHHAHRERERERERERGRELLSGISPFGDDASSCIGLTTAEARRLAKVLDRARVKRPKPTYVLLYQLDVARGVPVEIWFAPMLPNGEWVRSGGG